MNSLIEPKRTNTILYCHHWPETIAFYKDRLKLPVAFANEWFVEFQLTTTSFLSIANAARATITAVQGQGMTLTLEVTNVSAVKAGLEKLGIATTPLKRRWNALAFYCFDPEGHRLEFWTAENEGRS
ncbi:MAG: glyoxalase [Anaerolineaceae bacterium]|nr:glyoxalase [Anaerolineaceae bacterium]